MLGVEKLLDRYVQQISGGEQQRVAIGRAIVQKPNLCLLDEPISNLDASLRETVRTEVRRLQRQLGATMIMVTHDQMDALAVADRIAVLGLGVLRQIGTPEELYQRPANLFVAGFIGSMRMNLLPCRYAGRNSRALKGQGFQFPLPAEAEKGLPTREGWWCSASGPRSRRFTLRRRRARCPRPWRPHTSKAIGSCINFVSARRLFNIRPGAGRARAEFRRLGRRGADPVTYFRSGERSTARNERRQCDALNRAGRLIRA